MRKLIVLMLALMMLLTGSAFTEEAFRIVSPEGAPALAAAGVKENLRTVAADEIAGVFAKEEADFIIAPVNAGAKLFKAGKSTYRLVAVVTWGNLVFASQIPDFSPKMIDGRSITLFGENTINASVALFILEQKGIIPSEINYLATAQQTQALLLEKPDSIVMTAEPAATVAGMKNEAVKTYSLTELYAEITGDDGFVQAGLFVREKTLQEKPEQVKNWIAMLEDSANRCMNDPEAVAKDAVELGIMPNENIAVKALPQCNIRFVYAKDAQEQIEKTVYLDPAQYGGDIPADDFYYVAE